MEVTTWQILSEASPKKVNGKNMSANQLPNGEQKILKLD